MSLKADDSKLMIKYVLISKHTYQGVYWVFMISRKFFSFCIPSVSTDRKIKKSQDLKAKSRKMIYSGKWSWKKSGFCGGWFKYILKPI